MNRFCQVDCGGATDACRSHESSQALRERIYQTFPSLEKEDWEILYGEKRAFYEQLLHSSHLEAMPGVEKLLLALEKANKRRCVVTNSFKNQTEILKASLPVLATIPFWITREDYLQPKPSSECYQKAMALYGKKGDRIIGFEDSPRGVRALEGVPAEIVMISSSHEVETLFSRKVFHYASFEEIPEDRL